MSREICGRCGNAFEVDGSHICPGTKFKIAAPQPSAEPVAHLYRDHNGELRLNCIKPVPHFAFPIYTHPQPDDTALLRQALAEWWEKTDWVQESAQPGELGMHRADVLAMRLNRAVNALAEAHSAYQAKLAKDDALLKRALGVLYAIISDGVHCDVVPHLHRDAQTTIAALRERLGETK